MDINEILRVLPHRYPFLLIDRVIELVRKQRLVAIKNVTIDEPFFAGHFPGLPIMPGVLIVEAMAQAGGVLLLTEFGDRDQKLVLFTAGFDPYPVLTSYVGVLTAGAMFLAIGLFVRSF